MSGQSDSERGASPFGRGAILAVLLVGFTAFVAMLYFIGIGDTGGPDESGGRAHAESNGLNGYSGLVKLLEGEGIQVNRTRGREGLETNDLLILTPQQFTDPQEFAQVLENREYLGPTLVILPKWMAYRPRGDVAEDYADKVRGDWVRLMGAVPLAWTTELPEPFKFAHSSEELEGGQNASWKGLSRSGSLPTASVLYAEKSSSHEALIVDGDGRTLAFNVVGTVGSNYYENAHWTMFVVEPDLMNNYGMADPQRAAAALALVREAGYGDMTAVTVDMTMNGYGSSTNLLTLAFQPPFLAATLCLILAMLIVGWRAFLRFGPTTASAQEIAFGKERLVSNGAGLIVRARRLGLLAGPYASLIERRLGHALGIARPDPEAIDHALAIRLPDEEPFSVRAARLHNADKPMEILHAAQALNDLTRKLAK